MKRKSGKLQKEILSYTVFFEPADEGGYVVTVPALTGCVTQGENLKEAIEMAQDAIQLYLATEKDLGSDRLDYYALAGSKTKRSDARSAYFGF